MTNRFSDVQIPGAGRAPRILILSEIRLYREGLESILAADGRLDVRATGVDLAAANDCVEDQTIEVVLLDTGMVGGLDFVRTVRNNRHGTKIVALGLNETADDILPYLESGISAYVCREGTVDELVQTVLCALSGELICSREIADALRRRLARLASSARSRSSDPPLTPRERQIARSLEQGMSNKQIATSLHITVSTVKNHVHSVLEKLHVRTRLEAAARLRELRQ